VCAFPEKSVINHHYPSSGSALLTFETHETTIFVVLSVTNFCLARQSILSTCVHKPSMKCNEEAEEIKSRSGKLEAAIYCHCECTLI